MLTRRALLSAAAVAGCGMLAVRPALARPYPTRPIKLINPFPPGGPSEPIVRLVSERLAASLGQPVIVENRPGGAGGTVGAKSVAVADPDGYTLLFSTPGPLAIAPAVYRDIGYDPLKAFTPVAMVFTSPQMLVVNPAMELQSLRGLVSRAKANPGKINFASPGYGTQPHLLGEMFKLTTGVDIVHVPYKGAAQAITDLLAGRVQMEFETIPLLLPHVETGKLTALALADDMRSAQLPNVPTTTESGYPKLQGSYWTGILAPAGTPAAIVDTLNGAINTILKSQELRVWLAKLGATAKLESPQDFAAFMEAEGQKWTEVAKGAGVRVE